MKRFMKLVSVVLVLGAVATASSMGGNPEVVVQKKSPLMVEWNGGNHCDPIERLMGMCRSSGNILTEN